MEQKRILLAFVLSAVTLFAWTYLFAPKPLQSNTNSQVSVERPSTSPTQNISDIANPNPTPQPDSPITPTDGTPHRLITVSTPLYELTIDNRGGVVTSWIIKKNKETGRSLYSAAGDKNSRQPLELIPSDTTLRNLPDAPLPFRLYTGDNNLNNFAAYTNYSVSGLEGNDTSSKLEIKENEVKSLEFLLRHEATGLEVVKSLQFNASTYTVDLGVRLTRGGQPVQNVALAIGPSIGDQGVSQYSFYTVAPEGIVGFNNTSSIFTGQTVYETNDRTQTIADSVDWVGIGDTYFAMAAVPAIKTQGVAFRSAKYSVNETKEERYFVTALLPVPADGSLTRVYVGPKDHDQLNIVSQDISSLVKREIDLERLINYGWLGFFSRYLTAPIFWALKYLHALTGSYGAAIILFTIVIYSLFFPLKWRSSKAMKKAQKHAPRMKEIQEKMKGLKQTDPRLKDLQMEQLRLMKEANPLGGCLPLLIQMPFLIALYTAITISIDFRQSSFLWMPDLSSADPYKLLPILMAASMVILQFITPAPSADPLQRKMMAVVLPVIMLYMLWTAPAGLLVYWFVGNIVGFTQQLIINRLMKSESDEEAQPPGKHNMKMNKLSEARANQS